MGELLPKSGKVSEAVREAAAGLEAAVLVRLISETDHTQPTQGIKTNLA